MIYVFKTSVNDQTAVWQLTPLLNNLLQQSAWNFDLDDCDKILRIDSPNDISKNVVKGFESLGFYCEELE